MGVYNWGTPTEFIKIESMRTQANEIKAFIKMCNEDEIQMRCTVVPPELQNLIVNVNREFEELDDDITKELELKDDPLVGFQQLMITCCAIEGQCTSTVASFIAKQKEENDKQKQVNEMMELKMNILLEQKNVTRRRLSEEVLLINEIRQCAADGVSKDQV